MKKDRFRVWIEGKNWKGKLLALTCTLLTSICTLIFIYICRDNITHLLFIGVSLLTIHVLLGDVLELY